MTNAPKYTSLIREAEKSLRREIRRTRRPIFNLWRLFREPCKQTNCSGGHGNTTLDRGFGQIMACFITAVSVFCLILGGMDIAKFSKTEHELTSKLLAVLIALSFFWAGMQWLNHFSWSDHAEKLEERREELQTKLKEPRGKLLVAMLEAAITKSEESLFGEKSDFHGWTQKLEGRGKEVGSPTETVTERTPPERDNYRTPSEVTHVRVILEKEDFAKVLEQHLAFRTSSKQSLDDLRTQARRVGECLDHLDSVCAMPNTRRDANEQIARLEDAIQEGVDAIHDRLDELADETVAAVAKAAQASTASYAIDAQRVAQSIREPVEVEPEVPAPPTDKDRSAL